MHLFKHSLPHPHHSLKYLNHIAPFSTKTPPPPNPTPKTLATLILTTPNQTHLATHLTTQIPWTTTLINQTLTHLSNHPPLSLFLFSVLDRHPVFSSSLSLSSFHLALDSSARLRLHPLTSSLLRRLRHRITPFTLTLLLDRYLSSPSPDFSIKFFLRFCRDFHFLDGVVFLNCVNSMLDLLCKAKRVDKAVELMGLLKGRVLFDVVSFNIVANGWCLVRKMNYALAVLTRMVELGIDPNLTTYNVILKGYFRNGEVRKAWAFFKEMRRRKCGVDVFTYTTLIHGFGVRGYVGKARELFDGMARDGVLPNVVTYNGLIRVLCWEDSVESAVELYEDMVRKGYVPNAVTYNMLIREFCHRGDFRRAGEFVEVMRKEGFEPNEQTFNLLIRYYCKEGEIEKGMELFRKMGKEECLPNLDTYNVLIKAMFVRGRSEDVVVAGRLLIEMVDRGFVPSRVNFNRVLDGLLMTGNQEFAREILRLQTKVGSLPRHFRL